jgi:predicted negative regulator of RcsB-dependent stress response
MKNLLIGLILGACLSFGLWQYRQHQQQVQSQQAAQALIGGPAKISPW